MAHGTSYEEYGEYWSHVFSFSEVEFLLLMVLYFNILNNSPNISV